MAQYGLRIKHPSTGAVLLDIADSITRVIGTVSTGTANGSLTVPTELGRAFFQCLAVNDFTGQGSQPSIIQSGNSITWTFPTQSGVVRVPMLIVYGVY